MFFRGERTVPRTHSAPPSSLKLNTVQPQDVAAECPLGDKYPPRGDNTWLPAAAALGPSSCPEGVGARSARLIMRLLADILHRPTGMLVASSGRGISSVTEGTPSAVCRTGNEGFVPQRHKPHTGWARSGHCRAPGRKRGFGRGEDSGSWPLSRLETYLPLSCSQRRNERPAEEPALGGPTYGPAIA